MSEEKLNGESKKQSNFIRDIIDEDLKSGKHKTVHTRFPPEPNGYLHIGHAKSICLNFGLAIDYNGKCNLRFDDTNPTKEEQEYVDSIKEDIKWLGFDWQDREYYASDYFEQLYEYAITLIKKGKAYVDSLTADQIRETRGTPTEAGKESPYRNRSVDENLDLFEKMKNGKFKEGEYVLRAKIDMASPNLNMRDPVMYRILHKSHHRTGSKWCIYPMYDWAHGQSDSIERITHSLCTLEFENHRPLYDWFVQELEIYPPRQIEFARLNLSYTIMSKRKLLSLVEGKLVDGWDDPRLPTISGLRRRGYTPESIRNFSERVGMAKRENTIDVSLLEFSVREDLNLKAKRVMAVLNPLKVVITNYPDDQTEDLEAVNNPEDSSMGTRSLPFSKEIFIDKDDFREVPPPKFHRLSPGKEVRLRYAYIITCDEVIKDKNSGEVIELRCTYFPDTKSGSGTSSKKAKGTIHWVSAQHAFEAEVRLYDRLFSVEDPEGEEGKEFTEFLNPNSLEILNNCKLEPSLKNALAGEKFQFERIGYFCVDAKYSKVNLPVFNRIVTLRDSWAKIEQAGKN
ncbi:MAG TPA: glutamine--tRNA ligase/YqeY domain fusion protein [Ignavibacteriaceae bacterium]|nr:glutamine--tRNA ligase/YqeY domain fusion protein [Ignavibacteriaceae bacterium]